MKCNYRFFLRTRFSTTAGCQLHDNWEFFIRFAIQSSFELYRKLEESQTPFKFPGFRGGVFCKQVKRNGSFFLCTATAINESRILRIGPCDKALATTLRYDFTEVDSNTNHWVKKKEKYSLLWRERRFSPFLLCDLPVHHEPF